MNSIQAEQLRQALALQGALAAQAQAAYLKTNPMANDSYSGNNKKGTLGLFTKIAIVAAAVIFRKNIANVAKKYFPNISQDILTAAKGAGEKLSKVKGSGYVKSGWDKYVKYEAKAKNYISEKLSTETGYKFKKKVEGFWNWLKGVISRNETPKATLEQMEFDFMRNTKPEQMTLNL